jgi:hypothetical protein
MRDKRAGDRAAFFLLGAVSAQRQDYCWRRRQAHALADD